MVDIAIFISALFDVLVLEQLLLHLFLLLNDVAVFADSEGSRLADFGITLVVFFFRVGGGIFCGVLF